MEEQKEFQTEKSSLFAFDPIVVVMDVCRHWLLILIMALIKPVSAYVMAAYHTLRCGGNTLLTFAYDGLPMFLLGVPLAFILSRYTNISILPLFFICQMPDVVKMIAGMYMIRSRRWMNRLTEKAA